MITTAEGERTPSGRGEKSRRKRRGTGRGGGWSRQRAKRV